MVAECWIGMKEVKWHKRMPKKIVSMRWPRSDAKFSKITTLFAYFMLIYAWSQVCTLWETTLSYRNPERGVATISKLKIVIKVKLRESQLCLKKIIWVHDCGTAYQGLKHSQLSLMIILLIQ